MHTTTGNDIDYLLIGHVTEDLQSDGSVALGGTVTYAGLTAQALGHQPAIITSCAEETPLKALNAIPIKRLLSPGSTQFRNIPIDTGRMQYLYRQATIITAQSLPEKWSKPAIVHIAPVFNDVDPAILAQFPDSFRCLTPQGWMREVDKNNRVQAKTLSGLDKWLGYTHAIVLSREDLQGDMDEASRLANLVPTLVITDRENGAHVYFKGKIQHFPAPNVELIDDTGSGDIFATCFFHHLYRHQNPWQAARFAVELASQSVTRRHLNSIPTKKEIQKAGQLALEKALYG